MSLKNIYNPVLFQGHLQKKHYFEGWYFKQVTADGKQTVSLIPGISLDGSDSHCFVQVILSPNIQTYYFKYPISQFSTTEEPFSVTVGESVFSMEGCHIVLNDALQSIPQGISMTGDLYFSNLSPIQSSPLMPNIMGFFAYIPHMECNHGVISINHGLMGHIEIDQEQKIDFDGGKGYLEKDWGTSFPSEYIWLQANHFEKSDAGFMCSLATIPFGLFSFKGLIANLQLDGVEYRFATYNGAKVTNLKIEDYRLSFNLVKGDVTLSCEGLLTEAGELKAPEKGEMLRTIKEGLSGEVTLTLSRKGHSTQILKSDCAGIEIVGGIYETQSTQKTGK